MKFGIFTIKDKVNGYTGLMLDNNHNSAMRNFEHAFRDTKSLYYTHPSDFELFYLGTYDSETGFIDYCVPEFVCAATDFERRNDEV